jgi:hypothetical protein
MGRKSSAKAQSRPTTPGEPPQAPRRSFTPLLAIAVAAVLIAGVFAVTRGGGESISQPLESAAQAAQTPAAPAAPPQWAAFGPHPQENLPPLPFQSFAPPRPPQVVQAAYRFAAEHPEILSYVPCFCGCERAGHQGNEDCFVKARNAKGDVTEWDPHGLDCAVCLDVATEAMQMHRSGANVRDIRAAIEKKWTSPSAGHTHTPPPPAK